MWTVIVSDQRGQVVAQHEWRQGSLTIGREQGRSIVLPSKTASRKHARLDLVNGMPVVVDEGSANGTLVNGARIGGPTRVDEHSKIDVAEFRITLQRPQEDDGERTVLMRPRSMTPPVAATVPPAAPPRPAPPPVSQTMTAAPRPAAPAPPRPAAPAAPAMPAMPSMPSMPSAPTAPAAPGGTDFTSQFERHLQSVRQYREESQATTLNRRTRLDNEWGKIIASMRALQTRLATDPRVLSFVISRDLKEVSLKVKDPHEKLGYRYFLLSRDHPEGKFPGVDAVWLREFGRDDARFDDPQKAVEELMLRIAGTLA